MTVLSVKWLDVLILYPISLWYWPLCGHQDTQGTNELSCLTIPEVILSAISGLAIHYNSKQSGTSQINNIFQVGPHVTN